MPIPTIALLFLTATGYAVATVDMKAFSGTPGLVALTVIALGLLLAIAMEVLLLRQSNLSMVDLGIMIAKMALVVGYAFSIDHGLSAGTNYRDGIRAIWRGFDGRTRLAAGHPLLGC